MRLLNRREIFDYKQVFARGIILEGVTLPARLVPLASTGTGMTSPDLGLPGHSGRSRPVSIQQLWRAVRFCRRDSKKRGPSSALSVAPDWAPGHMPRNLNFV
jgi:hypothetical protein